MAACSFPPCWRHLATYPSQREVWVSAHCIWPALMDSAEKWWRFSSRHWQFASPPLGTQPSLCESPVERLYRKALHSTALNPTPIASYVPAPSWMCSLTKPLMTPSPTNVCAPRWRPPDHWALRRLTGNNKLPLESPGLGSISCVAIDKWNRCQTNCPRNHLWWL